MKKSIPALKLAIIGAALATSTAAFAHDTGAAHRGSDRAFHHACHHGHHAHHKGHNHQFHKHGHGMAGHRHAMRDVGLSVPGYGVISRDFVQGMGLKEDQLKLIEDARNAAKELRSAQREQFKTLRSKPLERFSSEVDPERALKEADERRAQLQAQRRELDNKWVAVWKSLDGDQQARVADHLKERAEKAQQRAEKRAGKHSEKGPSRHDRENAPTSQPA